jgi:hypothetical protein
MTMLVTPRPGTSLDNLVKSLQRIYTDALNLRGGGAQTAHKRLLAYLEWAGQSARMLHNQVSESDVAALVLNRRYELLLSSSGTMAGTAQERVVNDLVSLELDQRVADFEEAINSLQTERQRWLTAGALVVPDSSFYIQYKDKLEDVDFRPLLSIREENVNVLIPIVVVDELDGLKQYSKQHVRWRARHTLAVLDRVLRWTTGRATLRESDFSVLGTGGIPRGEVTVELLFDSPGHIRLPINDDEIVDRALAVQILAERPVALLTYDTGMSTRARNAGLRVEKLSEDVGEEPKPS